MATLTLADYITLLDNTKRIDDNNNSVALLAQIPSDFVKGTGKAKPILQFKIRAYEASQLEININRSQSDPGHAHTMSFGASGTFRTYHEFISGNLFNPGEQNEIRFTMLGSVLDNEGDVGISDVLLTFQRRVQI